MLPKLPLIAKKMIKRAKDEIKVGSISKEQTINKKNKELDIQKLNNNSFKKLNISKMKSNAMIKGHNENEKVKVYDINNTEKFVQIIWPKNSAVKNILFLVKEQIENGKVMKV